MWPCITCCAHVHIGSHGDQEKVLDPLEVGLQAVKSHHAGAEIKSWSSAIAVGAINQQTISPVPRHPESCVSLCWHQQGVLGYGEEGRSVPLPVISVVIAMGLSVADGGKGAVESLTSH